MAIHELIVKTTTKDKSWVKKLTVWEVRNPKDPRLNDTTGGTAPLNKFDACSITPSPPKQATKSTLSCRSLHQGHPTGQQNTQWSIGILTTISMLLLLRQGVPPPGVFTIKGLNKSEPWDSSKYDMHIRFHKNIHFLFKIQKRGNLKFHEINAVNNSCAKIK